MVGGVLETIDGVPTVFLDLEKLPTWDKDRWGERLKGETYNTLDMHLGHGLQMKDFACICVHAHAYVCICIHVITTWIGNYIRTLDNI